MDPIYIFSARRTVIGDFKGSLKNHGAVALGVSAVRAALADSPLPTSCIGEVIMGTVLSAGLGQAPARQVALGAGLPTNVNALTLNKVCGSGMQALMDGARRIQLGEAQAVVAGGMESMTNAPYLLPKARMGYGFGDGLILDHLAHDGLCDSIDHGGMMGNLAETVAKEAGLDRKKLDDFALGSLKKAQKAWKDGGFARECVPVGSLTTDEHPTRVRTEKIPTLKPAFSKDGIITAANASCLSDGAAAVVLGTQALARQYPPMAQILGWASHSQGPATFTQAPITAIRKLLKSVGWHVGDVDHFEINEAFAAVPLLAAEALALPLEKINIHGGACALGHPLGASGARIMVTLLHGLKTHGLKRGVGAICIGGGEALAMAIEIL